MAFLKTIIVLGLSFGVVSGRLLTPRQSNTTCTTSTQIHNFTLTIDVPGFVLDGMVVGYAAAGLFTNVSTSSVQYSPTHFYKNDTDTMYANFVGGNGFIGQDWQASVSNSSTSSFPGLAALNYPGTLQYDQSTYIGSFFVIGDDEADPWGSNPHIGFKPDDGVGNGSWWACPKWFDDSWRIFGGVAKFSGYQSAYPAPIPCTAIGNLKVNLIDAENEC